MPGLFGMTPGQTVFLTIKEFSWPKKDERCLQSRRNNSRMNAISTFAAWSIAPDDFPADEGADQKLRFMLNFAILAPSTHNTQPWLFRLQGHEVELLVDRKRALPVVDPSHRELIMSCGAALHHLQLASRYFGYNSEIELFPDEHEPDLLARLSLGLQCDTNTEDILLFNAIQKRRTSRLPFAADPVPESVLRALQEMAREQGTWLHVVSEEETRYQIAALVEQADRIQWRNKNFRQELASWTTPNASPRHDGVPGYAEGRGDFISQLEPLLIRRFDMGKGRAAHDREVAIYSPVLAVLGTDDDSRYDWLRAGQALSGVLLRARAEDVSASFLNQVIETPETRSSLGGLIARSGFPHILLRLGFGPDVKPTPRRSLQDLFCKTRNSPIRIH
jgi:hypothetical protein